MAAIHAPAVGTAPLRGAVASSGVVHSAAGEAVLAASSAATRAVGAAMLWTITETMVNGGRQADPAVEGLKTTITAEELQSLPVSGRR